MPGTSWSAFRRLLRRSARCAIAWLIFNLNATAGTDAAFSQLTQRGNSPRHLAVASFPQVEGLWRPVPPRCCGMLRQGAAHPYMRRPGLRVRRGLVELRPPARRPPQQGGIVGHSAGPGKDARPVKPAFATPSFPIPDIEIFHTDRGSEFNNAEIDLILEALGIEHQVDLGQGLPP